jgi:hypothetical protein
MVSLLGTSRPTVVNAATEYNEKIPFTDDFDACSGERITVDAIQYVTGHVTKSANSGLHYVFTRNTKGTGIGQSTGDKYIFTDALVQLNLDVKPGETQTLSQEYQNVIIHLGEKLPADDTIIHFLSKFTIDANGNILTTMIEIQSVECR